MGIAVSRPGRTDTNNDTYAPNIAPEYQGLFPVHKPTLNGFAQVLLLDDEWLIVVSHPMQDLIDEIDDLSGNVFKGHITTWVDSDKGGNPNFTHRANTLWVVRDQYIAEARETVEVPLGVAANFSITSADDSNYSSAKNPDQCTKVYVSKGRWRDWEKPVNDGTFVVDWLIYSYIQLPERMVNGSTYTITHSNGDSATFTYDLDAIVSRAIKVNQSGYLSTAGTKKAYIGAYLYDFGAMDLSHVSSFEIVDAATGIVVESGTPTLVEANPKVNPVVDSGTTTATTANKLVQSGQNFTTTVSVGDRVYNTTDTTEANVSAVDSDTTLSLSADIMTTGETYEIRKSEGVEDNDLLYGEDVYEIDFSSMTETGEFYIRVPGVGRSWPFKHSTDAYNEAFYTSCRGLYHQRAGVPITGEHSHWPRQIAKMSPWYECDHVDFPIHSTDTPAGYVEFDVVENTISYSSYTEQQPGGWHDAADFDLRGHHYTCVFDLLYAYQFNSARFTDSQLDIPESGNGIPDILCEARHGLKFWLATMNGSGGVSGDLETWTHPTIDSTNYTYETNFWYALSQRTRHNSLMFAAAAAMYAELVAPHDATESTTWTTHATDAYAFGNNAANSLGSTTIDGLSWTETNDHVNPYWMHAKLRLYLLTDNTDYLTDAPSISTLETAITGSSDGGVEPYNWRFTRYDWSPWIFYSIIEAYDAGATTLSSLASKWTTWFTNDADLLVDDLLPKNPYAHTNYRNISIGVMRWGNAHPSNYNRSLAIAHQLTSTSKYLDAMSQNMDFMFGCNPMGMCWTTGIGSVYPIDFQNWVSDYDGIGDPVPGITIYGITGDEAYGTWYWQVWNEVASNGGSISSLTQSGGTATAVCSSAHGLTSGDPIQIQGANETEYNVYGDATVTNTTTFTYPVDSGADATATGTLTWHHNFVESVEQRLPPRWRKWWCHPTLNVTQNEYTVDNTMGAVMFSCAYLMASGFSPTSASMVRPRNDEDLHGNFYLI